MCARPDRPCQTCPLRFINENWMGIIAEFGVQLKFGSEAGGSYMHASLDEPALGMQILQNRCKNVLFAIKSFVDLYVSLH